MGFKQKIARGLIKAKKAVIVHGPTVCTVLGCIGVAATGILAWQGRAKCDDILDEMPNDATALDKIKATAKAWGPAAAVGAISMGAIVLSNGLSRKQMAALITCNAANTSALMRTSEAIKERSKTISDANKKALLITDEEDRRQMIFESDCDLNIICLDPDGIVYWDDWADIYFRQKPEVVEKGYYAFNREYADLGWVSIHRLYELWGFNKSDWSQIGIKTKFKDIGFERYLPFEEDKDFVDQYTSPSGEDFIDFKETCGKKSRIFGKESADDAIWSDLQKDFATRITYIYAPHTLYKPYMSMSDFEEYTWNMSFSGNRRFNA